MPLSRDLYSLNDMIQMDIESLHGKIFKMIGNGSSRECSIAAGGAQKV